MGVRRLGAKFMRWLGGAFLEEHSQDRASREPLSHVIILDGTMSSLEPGFETHAGMTYRLCREMGPQVSVYYEAGVQWSGWAKATDVMVGKGINRKIRRAYGYLASRYRPGDNIFLIGYSRGAYAVRSLAGVLGNVGLLRQEHATERNILMAYRHYQCDSSPEAVAAFAEAFCHENAQVEMVGVWDTVKALGLRLPILWRWADPRHAFHNHQLGPHVKNGFQALALNETRNSFEPVLWDSTGDFDGHVEQVWFRGTHGDVGGQLGGYEPARPLANLSLVWMLERAENCGLPLPVDWRMRFPVDPSAPSIGSWTGAAKLFVLRSKRQWGTDPSERVHPSALPSGQGNPAGQRTSGGWSFVPGFRRSAR